MPFTDDDLKRFHSEYIEMGSDKIDALIARLEAAEACLRGHDGACLSDIDEPCTCGQYERIDTYRKAAGKS